jgi:hypothetical protein
MKIFGRFKCRCENNNKIYDGEETVSGFMGDSYVAEKRVRWWALVNSVMNIPVL